MAFSDFLAIIFNSPEFARVSNHPAYRRQWQTQITEMGLPSSTWARNEHAVGRAAAGLMAVPLREVESHHRKYILNSPGQLYVI